MPQQFATRHTLLTASAHLLLATGLVACSGDSADAPRPDGAIPDAGTVRDAGTGDASIASDARADASADANPDASSPTPGGDAGGGDAGEDAGADAAGPACTDTQSDPAHCGACGQRCAFGASCQAGVCACPAEAPDVCDNQCVDRQTSPGHCGACGVICGLGETCVAGACQSAPPREVLIPAGTYTQGPDALSGEGVSRAVTISRPFHVQNTEVTQRQWRDVLGTAPASARSCGLSCPVENVNWFEALAYLNALSTQAGLPTCYELTGCRGTLGSGCPTGDDGRDCADVYTCTGVTFAGPACTGYRLPTEAEWEYAARGMTTTNTYAGELPPEALDIVACEESLPILGPLAHYLCNTDDSAQPVGLKTPNAYGLHDVLGNVWEWTWDVYTAYTPEGVTDPTGPRTGIFRVLRGGSWLWGPDSATVNARDFYGSSYRGNDVGFRAVRTAE